MRILVLSEEKEKGMNAYIRKETLKQQVWTTCYEV